MKCVRQTQTAIMVMILVCQTGGLFAAGRKEATLREPLMTPLVSHALIREAGWTYNWQLNLPVKSDEQIDRMLVHGDYLFVLTDTNILFCIQRQQGRTLHVVSISRKDVPVCSPIFYEGVLGFIAGNQIRIFDPSNGFLQQAEAIEQVGNIFECGLSRNEQFIYIAGTDNRLHAISPDGYWEAFTATADNDSSINSIIATNSIVVFSTIAGNVVGMQPDAAKKIWQYDISGPIRADLVTDGEFIYVAGRDAKLYKLHLETGKLAWNTPYHSGAPIIDPAVIGRDVVYIFNKLNGFYAVNKDTGQAVWNLATGDSVICEADNQAFVFARPGVLKVMDNKTGKEVYSVNFSQVQRHVENMTDSVMYIADKAGRVMSVTVDKK